jgi:hypothetical protein
MEKIDGTDAEIIDVCSKVCGLGVLSRTMRNEMSSRKPVASLLAVRFEKPKEEERFNFTKLDK